MRTIACLIAFAPAAAIAGPISKFDARPPAAIYESTRTIEQVERCLIDVGKYGLPNIYRQPDRPDFEMLVWSSGTATAIGRVDLLRLQTGTRVTDWLDDKQVAACAGQ